ncbi:MAG: AraC family transcriptional regulator [Bacteroidota bacterium]
MERPQRPTLKEAWHFHPEVEICLTRKSEGKRFVGNNIEDYRSGDLVMFGSNLPHGFITKKKSNQVVIQMQENFLGNDFLEKPETQIVKDLFFRAKRGLKFEGGIQQKANDKIEELFQLEGLPQVLKLLDLLYLFASTQEYRYITQENYIVDTKMAELKRIQIVYSYILENYQTGVSLEEAAALIPMTKSSFCKFLKKHAKKTFSEIVNEIRISHACELMIQTDMKISSIAYESGFNDISYFNRIFKKIIKSSPKEFVSTKRDYQA